MAVQTVVVKTKKDKFNFVDVGIIEIFLIVSSYHPHIIKTE